MGCEDGREREEVAAVEEEGAWCSDVGLAAAGGLFGLGAGESRLATTGEERGG